MAIVDALAVAGRFAGQWAEANIYMRMSVSKGRGGEGRVFPWPQDERGHGRGGWHQKMRVSEEGGHVSCSLPTRRLDSPSLPGWDNETSSGRRRPRRALPLLEVVEALPLMADRTQRRGCSYVTAGMRGVLQEKVAHG